MIRVGGRVDEASICLRIFGDDLDPDELTTRLGVQPTSFCRKGDLFQGKRYERIEKTGRWLLDRPHSSDDIDVIVKKLLLDLPDSISLWESLHKRFAIDLFLGVWMRDWNRGFSLLPDTLAMLGDRKLQIGFDIYCDVAQPDLEFDNEAE